MPDRPVAIPGVNALVLEGRAIIAIDDFTRYFWGTLRSNQRKAKSGRWKSAHYLGGRWYVVVSASALAARVEKASSARHANP